MLAQLVRRLSLTGLLMASLVGTGLLFGSAGPMSQLDTNIAEKALNVAEVVAIALDDAKPPEANAVPSGKASGADLRWPFFTFGGKRSGPSW